MTKKEKILRELTIALSYVLVAVAAAVITLAFTAGRNTNFVFPGTRKLEELQKLIETYYIDIDKIEMTKVEDAAAGAMIEALGDRWSYYVTAEEYAQLQEQNANSYVGIGITIQARDDKNGFNITKVEPGGCAQAGGILPGDMIVSVNGEDMFSRPMDYVTSKIKGDVGTSVSVSVKRGEQILDFNLVRC